MSPWTKYPALAATCFMALSGTTYYVFKNWFDSDDPFSVVSHPLEPLSLKAHILAGPLLVFVFGLLFQSHVVRKIRTNSNQGKASGVVTALLFSVSVLSGYLLQTVSHPWLRSLLVYTHLIGGLCLSIVFLSHVLRSWRQAQIKAQTEAETERLAA